jgi:hypothetical protein
MLRQLRIGFWLELPSPEIVAGTGLSFAQRVTVAFDLSATLPFVLVPDPTAALGRG